MPRKPAVFGPGPDPAFAAPPVSRARPGRGRACVDLAMEYFSLIFRIGAMERPATLIYIKHDTPSFCLLPSALYPKSKSPSSCSKTRIWGLIENKKNAKTGVVFGTQVFVGYLFLISKCGIEIGALMFNGNRKYSQSLCFRGSESMDFKQEDWLAHPTCKPLISETTGENI